MGEPSSCWPFWHRWSKYEDTKVVTDRDGQPTVAQRRVCQRCNAVDYRRAGISNA